VTYAAFILIVRERKIPAYKQRKSETTACQFFFFNYLNANHISVHKLFLRRRQFKFNLIPHHV